MQIVRVLAASAAMACAGGAVAQSAGVSDELHQTIKSYFGVRGYSVQAATIRADAAISGRVLIDIDLGSGPTTLVMDPYSVRSPGFAVVEHGDSGLRFVDAPPISTYRGLNTSTGAVVAASILDGRISAAIRPIDGEPIFIQPVADADPLADGTQHIVYTASDIRGGSWVCGADNPACDDCDGPIGATRGPGGGCLETVEVLFDTDYPYFLANGGSTSAVVADVENIVNQCDVIYRRDLSVAFAISQVVVRSSATGDPYVDLATASVDPTTLLNRVRSVWSGVPTPQRDLVHLMTGRDLASTTIGIAYVGVVCRSSNVGVSQSRFTSNLGMRTVLTAHEIGHNFGSSHDSGGSFIMAPSTSPNSQQQFSSGSISVIGNYINGNGSCLSSAGPTAGPDSASTQAPQPVLIDVLANDASSCGYTLSVSLPGGGTSAGGSVSISAGTGPGGRSQIRYVPAATVPAGGLVDGFTYRVTESSTGLFATGAVSVTVTTSTPVVCDGDFNGSGAVSVQDIFDYLAAYFANEARSDVNQSGMTTVQDLFDFLANYFRPCP